MEAIWFAIVSAMLAVYAVLDGFDFGVGILHRLVARTDEERRTVLAAIGPIWDGNEVWLIAAGGVLFVAFPRVYATAFSGFYLALIIVLWLLILRGVSIEFRSHQENPLWREFWDTIFMVASALLAVVFGATLGNLIRGVPVGEDGLRGMPLFTNFRTGREPGILDWYTGLVGLFTLVALAIHGALYLAWKTTGPVREAQPGLRPTGVEGRAGPLGRVRPPPPPGCGPRSSADSPPAPGPLPSSRSRSPAPGGRTSTRAAAATSPRSSAPPRSCSGWRRPPWRAIIRSGCDRRSIPRTASPLPTPLPTATGWAWR